MVSGPLGVRRPFGSYKVIIDTEKQTLRIMPVGPLGFPRPLAKNNPPVTQERISECVISDAGRSFGAGSVSGGATTDISQLNPEAQAEAINRAEKWCEGVLESTAEPELDRGEAQAAFDAVREQIVREGQAPPGSEFTIVDEE